MRIALLYLVRPACLKFDCRMKIGSQPITPNVLLSPSRSVSRSMSKQNDVTVELLDTHRISHAKQVVYRMKLTRILCVNSASASVSASAYTRCVRESVCACVCACVCEVETHPR